ncbi:hypothetical protein N9L06_03240 [Mariniblastus sp.]|nr:hypothetical protein [Mariniblastus sp.]
MINYTKQPTAIANSVATSAPLRASLALGIACWFSLVSFTANQTTAAAMQVTSGEGRSVASPWRPSFGQVNQQAAAVTNNVTGTSGTQRTVDLSPTGSNNRNLNANANPNVQAGSGTRSNANEIQPIAAQIARARSLVPPPSKTPPVTRVTHSLNTLPNSAGQIWREYDISPYTKQISSVENPQQAIIDWILHETGTELWFSQPLGVLSANKNQLRVYHTPEIHNVVKPIVDRFIRTQAQLQSIDVSLVTIGNPNWRSQSYSILQSIDVQSPGIEAWLVSKENAALLLNGLSKRSDFRQISGGLLTNHDGQSLTLEKKQPVQFVRNLRWANNGIGLGAASPSVQPEMTTINEGYRLEIGSLSSLDNKSIEACVECEVNQVEKLNTVKVSVPDSLGNSMPMNLQIPQLVSWRLKERFRWPADQVLVLGSGMVANPEPRASKSTGLKLLGNRSERVEALLFLDYRGPARGASAPATASSRLAPITRK